MPNYNLDWDTIGANGGYTLTDGTDSTGVTIATDTNTEGASATAQTNGSPAESGLWVSGLQSAVTTTMTFDDPVQNLSFEIYDIDQQTGSWDDSLTIIAIDADGNQVVVNYSDLDGLHSVNGDTLDADGNASSGIETSGAVDSVTVTITGPITSLIFVFDHGTSDDISSTFGISDMTMEGVPPVSDGIVSGGADDDLIDLAYIGDPDGDMVTIGGDIIQAGDGNDNIYADGGNDIVHGQGGNDFISGGMGDDTLYGGTGDDTINGNEGNDLIYGGDGADTSEMGTGNDTFYGGAGNDWVNGDYGNDILHGGTGDDFLRGSFGNDTIYSGGAGEGNDYLWGGYGDDTFIIQNSFGNDTVDAENQDEVNGDTLDMSGVTDDLTVDLTHSNPGIGTFTDGTYTTNFNGIENIILGAGTDTLILADGSGTDQVHGFAAPTDNGGGSYTGNDQLDVSELTNDSGSTPVTVEDVTVTDDGNGNAVLTFPGGESITLIGVAPSQVDSLAELEALGIPPPPDGIVSGTAGDDTISFGYIDADGDHIDNNDARLSGEFGHDDIIEAGAGNDTINAGFGNDEVNAGTGDDLVHGWVGNDVIDGGDGNDTLCGDDGDDVIYGGAGNDIIEGGEGNDILDGGIGADTMNGGADRDTFTNVNAGDIIAGGETGDDHDIINMAGSGPYRILYDPNNSENGTIKFLDADGNITGSLSFTGIEEIVPCFTPRTRITTSRGTLPIEGLRVGDKVITRDNGYQEIRWIGKRRVDRHWMNRAPHLQPILIRKGALGNDKPDTDMLVSPNHRMLISEVNTAAYFGDKEVLAAAKYMIGKPGIECANTASATYIHLMFDKHEIINADNSWSESFQPGDYALSSLANEQRNEIIELFPQLDTNKSHKNFQAARRIIKRHEAALLGTPNTMVPHVSRSKMI